MHMLSRLDVSPRQFAKIVKKSTRGLYEKIARSMQSLTQTDHAEMLRKLTDA